MSLTSFLKNLDVKEKFKQEFPLPKLNIKKELLAPPLTHNWGLVGTAFDYLLRFYLKYLNPKAIENKWVAEHSLELIENKNLYRKVSKILSDAKKNYSIFLLTGEINNNLIKSALLLAQLDPIYREGYISRKIGAIDNRDIKDLKNLISIVNPKIFKAKNLCVLNPAFRASGLVGGADADLIIDDILIEIKTTKEIEIKREHFNQLIGYYALYKMGGFDNISSKYKKYGINRLGIYFSRFAYLWTIKIKDIINKNKFRKFLKWFKVRAYCDDVISDISQTFMPLLGLEVKKIKVKNKERIYIFIFGKEESKEVAVIWRDYDNKWTRKDFEKDKKIIIKELKDWKPQVVYVNGQSILASKNWELKYIEQELKKINGMNKKPKGKNDFVIIA